MTKCKLHYTRAVELPGFVARCILDCLAFRKAPTTVLLSGRPSTVLLLKELLALAQTVPDKGILQWLQLFQLDAFESVRDGPQNPWQILEQNFAAPALAAKLIGENQLHPFQFSGDRAADLRSYESTLLQFGESPHLIVLAVDGGEMNSGEVLPGHFAGIYPGSNETWDTNNAFVETSLFPFAPNSRVSATPALIRRTERVIALLCGNARVNVWNDYKYSTASERDVPLKLIDTSERNLLCCDVFQS